LIKYQPDFHSCQIKYGIYSTQGQFIILDRMNIDQTTISSFCRLNVLVAWDYGFCIYLIHQRFCINL